ncbi:MAG: MauE/DoxX family redox-associated membrane protein [Phycisphaerales bacterium]
MYARLSTIAAGIVIVVLSVSGVAKLYDLGEFLASLRSWTVLPLPLVAVLVFMVPLVEVAVAMWWMSGCARRGATCAAALVLLIFTLGYGWQAWIAAPPNCACWGKIRAFEAVSQEAASVVIRNGVLLGMLAPAAFLRQRSPSSNCSLPLPSLAS